MVIDDLNATWTRSAAVPQETDAPLVIDPDTPLAFAIPTQLLQMMAGEGSDIGKAHRHIEPIQHHFGFAPEWLERLDPFPSREPLGPGVPIAQDYGRECVIRYALRQA
jgi:hypothetical protein